MSVRSSNGSQASIRSQKNGNSWQINGIKSSGFYPVAMSPTACYNIVDHMNSHYRRIHRVQAAVDTSPPVSHQLRHSRSPSPSCSSSRPMSRSTSRTDPSRYTPVNREEVLQTTSKINYYLDALKREQQRLISQVAAPNPHFRRPASKNKTSRDGSKFIPPPRKSKDLIDERSEYFTAPKPFTPRLLRTDAKPRLQEYRWYNPPRRKEFQSEMPRGKRLSESTDSVNSDRWMDEESDKIDRNAKRLSKSIVQQRRKSSSRESLQSNSNQWSNISDDKDSLLTILHSQTFLKTGEGNLVRRDDSLQKELHKHGNDEDDEMKYLEFTVDVTNDILLRGIYTNKVLNQVFHSHMEKRRLELNMEKMMNALDQLRIDLGVVDDKQLNTQTFGYGLLAASSQESNSKVSHHDKAHSEDKSSHKHNSKMHLLDSKKDFIDATSPEANDILDPSDTIAQLQLESGEDKHSQSSAVKNEILSAFVQNDKFGVLDSFRSSCNDHSENRTYDKNVDMGSGTASEVEDFPSFEENGHGRDLRNKRVDHESANAPKPQLFSSNSGQQLVEVNHQLEDLQLGDGDSINGDFYENDIGDQF